MKFLPAACDALADRHVAAQYADPVVVIGKVVRQDIEKIIVARAVADRACADLAVDSSDSDQAAGFCALDDVLRLLRVKR